MMSPLQEPPTKSRRTSGEFVESAVLEAVIPASAELDLDQLFQEWDGELSNEVSSIVPFIEQRQFLLLDELVTVYIVLRTPSVGEKDLKTHLSKLSITVEAHAIGQQVVKPGDGSHPPQLREAKELLATETVSVSDDPMICATEIQAEGDSEPLQYIYIFWKAVLPIGRPKGRLQKLAIFFTPSAVLKPFPVSSQADAENDEYLPSSAPLAMNVLGPLANDPSLGKVAPFLSAARFSKPLNSKQEPLARPIRGGPRKLFRAAPAFLWRIRFLRYPALAEKDAMFACFDVEVTHFAACPISFDKITLQLSSGHAEGVGVKLPLIAGAGEQMTLIYKLIPPSDSSTRFGAEANFGSTDPLAGRTLSVTLSASALLSVECTPKVKIKWKTALEMPTSRPTSRADGGQPPAWSHNFGSVSRLGHDPLTMTGQVYEVDIGPPIPDGVSVSVTAPEKVTVGKLFRWEVLVINRSDKIQRFAIVPIPRRKIFWDGGHRGNTARPGSSGSTGGKASSNILDVAAPLVDENILYSMQKSLLMEASDLICLSPDVRIGSLGPSACYAADLQFVALTSGVLHLEALRLIDMATQHTVDIRQLPDIVASFGEEER